MEQTFMTIHNLQPEANILYASDSIFDILGYHPHEVQNRSCFDYFHPDEIPFARSVQSRGVLLDKAAVLHYARIMSKDGRWVSCECCFSVVHDVLIACTSVYRRGEKSERRALEAPHIRRLFSSSPRDPRYHMLEHLSSKFKAAPMEREPRAALIVNRFTRSLKIMYATPSVSLVLGLSPDELQERPLYCCIQDNCLPDASHCLESAKQNDSIAYLRFWYRDPRTVDDEGNPLAMDGIDGHGGLADGERPGGSPSDSEGGGAPLENDMAVDPDSPGTAAPNTNVKREATADYSMDDIVPFPSTSASSMSNPLERGAGAFDRHSADMAYQTPVTSASSVTATQAEARVDGVLQRRGQAGSRGRQGRRQPLELEAVVSCTSDGLVVVLRKAHPAIPVPHTQPTQAPTYANGLFAAPWAMHPVRPQYPPEAVHSFQAPLMPQYMPVQERLRSSSGPPMDQLMSSIRDVAVFAWGLVGINGRLTEYAHGSPHEDAQPDVLPVWDPHAGDTGYQGPVNNAAIRWAELERQNKGKAPQPSPSAGRFDNLGFNPFGQPAEQHFGLQGAALESSQNQQSPFAQFYPQTSPSVYGQISQTLPMPASFDGRSTHHAYGTQQQEHWRQTQQQSQQTSVFLSMPPSQPAQPQMQTHLHHHHHHLHAPQTSAEQRNGNQREALPRESWLDTVSTRPHSQGFVAPTTQPSSTGLQQNRSSFQWP